MSEEEEEQIASLLGGIFEDFIDLIGETKQMIWLASATRHREYLNSLKDYLAEQAVVIDDAELSLGRRPSWIISPTGHHSPNLTADVAGNVDFMIVRLVGDLEALAADVKLRSESADEKWRQFLVQIAEGLAAQAASLQGRLGADATIPGHTREAVID